ncbi:MAG TPA: amidase, partial [Patescibacteria group bacterium]|nr:amidase [Patescibacteria group bacterium]
MTKLTHLTMAEARDGLAAKSFSAVELVEAHLRAVEAGRGLNAFVTETPELAVERARASDARIAAGQAGAMEGLPIGMKDLFCTEGVRTTACSRILENFVPQYESTVSANLLKAGAVAVGKTALDEFAMGSSNQTSYFGPVVNPWTKTSDPAAKLVPGG